jgi:DNA polymerase III subunit epsilon
LFLFFDTETTGLPRRWDAPAEDLDNWPRLVQIAWILCDEHGNELDKQSLIVKPEGFVIPDDVAQIHGISNARAISVGAALDKVLSQFADALKKCGTLIAHNMNYDVNVLAAEYIRARIELDLSLVRKVCTKDVSTNYCRLPGKYGYKWPTLVELHTTLFGAEFAQKHDALDDVEACARCFFELVRIGVIDPPARDGVLDETVR